MDRFIINKSLGHLTTQEIILVKILAEGKGNMK